MTEEERLDLYYFVQGGLNQSKGKKTVTQLCGQYASDHGMTLDDCQREYVAVNADIAGYKAKLERMIPTVREQSAKLAKQLERAKSPRDREFKEWENDFIELFTKANPDLSTGKLGVEIYKIMPHRSEKAYSAHIYRQTQKEDKPVVEVRREEPEDEISPDLVDKLRSRLNPHKPEVVEATVVKVSDTWALLATDDARRGILHISEITPEYVNNIDDYLFVGQKIRAQVTKDKDGRMMFSTKRIGGIKKEEALEQRDKLSAERVQASDHRIEKHRRLLEAVGGFQVVSQPPTPSVAPSVPDDVVASLDGLISQFESNLQALKELRQAMIQKEIKVDRLRKSLAELL